LSTNARAELLRLPEVDVRNSEIAHGWMTCRKLRAQAADTSGADDCNAELRALHLRFPDDCSPQCTNSRLCVAIIN
jgi:hypothetical protein